MNASVHGTLSCFQKQQFMLDYTISSKQHERWAAAQPEGVVSAIQEEIRNMVINKAVRIYFVIGLALATFTGEALASCSSSGVNQVTCTGGQGASLSTGGGFGVETHGSPYPATLAVSSVSGTISGLQVRLNSFSDDVSRDLGVMLRSPSGRNLQLLREPRRGDAGSAVTFTITFADGGTVVPCTVGNFNTTGTYSPTNCTPESGTGNTPGTPPGGGNYGVAGTVNLAAPLGAATLTATNGVY